jgi:D-sedoheptulose 7-phosphate isomerase
MNSDHTDFSAEIAREFRESINIKTKAIEQNIGTINDIVNILIRTFRNGRKIFLFGNGGSAADAQHIAAEFISRFKLERRALPAIALTTDTSILTCIGNDYSFDNIFSRQLEALAQEGDAAIGISTSGNSVNVVKGLQTAKSMGCTTIGFTGERECQLQHISDVCLRVPSTDTAHIQEIHITAAHALCLIVERELAKH